MGPVEHGIASSAAGGVKRRRVAGRMAPKQATLYLTFLRSARAAAQQDAEDFDQLVQAFERIGSMKQGAVDHGLGAFRGVLMAIANSSDLATAVPAEHPGRHTRADDLFALLKERRNAAIHEGSVARNLARNCIELSLILEDALTSQMTKVSDLMIRDVAVAQLDHPISYIRQQMLVSSFSHLPFFHGQEWKLVSDHGLARWLRRVGTNGRKRWLAKSLHDALQDHPQIAENANSVTVDSPVESILDLLDWRPVLVVEKDRPERLCGLVSGYDLL